MAYLVDTSYWIDFFNGKDCPYLEGDNIDKAIICPPILQELLQGLKLSEVKLQSYLLALPVIESEINVQLYHEAANLYRLARKQGLTIRSSTDCLIASIAIKNNLPIVHSDRDYTQLAKVSVLEVVE